MLGNRNMKESSEQLESLKRNRADRSSTECTSSTEQLDFKRLRQVLSISSSEDSFLEPNETMGEPEPSNEPIVNELKQMNDRIDKMKNEIVTSIRDTLVGRIEQIEARVMDLETENQKLKQEMDKLKNQKGPEESRELVARLGAAERQIVELQQYSRSSSIKVLGVPEEDIEDTWEKVMGVFNEKLQVEVKKEDIVVAHRIANFRNAKPWAILG